MLPLPRIPQASFIHGLLAFDAGRITRRGQTERRISEIHKNHARDFKAAPSHGELKTKETPAEATVQMHVRIPAAVPTVAPITDENQRSAA